MRMLPRRFDLDTIFDSFMAPTVDMKCDIYEKDGNYHIEADMPGFNKEDVNVDFDNGYLTISAEKSAENNEDGKNFIRQERVYGSVERKFYVGDVEEDKIQANFNNGVLNIVLPKENAKKTTKSIEIQ